MTLLSCPILFVNEISVKQSCIEIFVIKFRCSFEFMQFYEKVLFLMSFCLIIGALRIAIKVGLDQHHSPTLISQAMIPRV